MAALRRFGRSNAISNKNILRSSRRCSCWTNGTYVPGARREVILARVKASGRYESSSGVK